MVQGLRLYTVSARGVGSTPGQGTKIPHAERCSPPIPPKIFFNFCEISAYLEKGSAFFGNYGQDSEHTFMRKSDTFV